MREWIEDAGCIIAVVGAGDWRVGDPAMLDGRLYVILDVIEFEDGDLGLLVKHILI